MKYKDFKMLSKDEMKQVKGGYEPVTCGSKDCIVIGGDGPKSAVCETKPAGCTCPLNQSTSNCF